MSDIFVNKIMVVYKEKEMVKPNQWENMTEVFSVGVYLSTLDRIVNESGTIMGKEVESGYNIIIPLCKERILYVAILEKEEENGKTKKVVRKK